MSDTTPSPSASLSASESRQRDMRALGSSTFDILVVGGGITGAGVAREAALRGLSVALVDRGDFGHGTSSRSSRLVHGGVRYLEHGYFRLVFESSRERRTLLRIAPHLVRPLRFVWPVYRGARVPRWKLLAGLALYDTLSLFRNVRTHRPLGASAVVREEPALQREGLVGGAQYFDAATDDTRLTLANVLSAREAGAVTVNYARVTGLRLAAAARAAEPHEVEVLDLLTQTPMTVRARLIVNATGAWTDTVRRMATGDVRTALRGTKGAHIAVPRERIGNVGAVTLLSAVDGRVMFVLPAGRQTIIGTTDTATLTSPDDVRASEHDVAYLLRSANAFFPTAALTRDDVIAAWAGIRPLVAAGHREDAARASREHDIAMSPAGLLNVTGGKLTTYRAMAAEVVTVAARSLTRMVTRRLGRSDRLPLPGGDMASYDSALQAARERVQDTAVAEWLVQAYGSRWPEVLAPVAEHPPLGRRLADGLPYIAAEVVYAVRREMALTIADVLIRRTHIAFETRDHGMSVAPRVAELLAAELGWDDATRGARIAEYRAESIRMFTVDAVERLESDARAQQN